MLCALTAETCPANLSVSITTTLPTYLGTLSYSTGRFRCVMRRTNGWPGLVNPRDMLHTRWPDKGKRKSSRISVRSKVTLYPIIVVLSIVLGRYSTCIDDSSKESRHLNTPVLVYLLGTEYVPMFVRSTYLLYSTPGLAPFPYRTMAALSNVSVRYAVSPCNCTQVEVVHGTYLYSSHNLLFTPTPTPTPTFPCTHSLTHSLD